MTLNIGPWQIWPNDTLGGFIVWHMDAPARFDTHATLSKSVGEYTLSWRLGTREGAPEPGVLAYSMRESSMPMEVFALPDGSWDIVFSGSAGGEGHAFHLSDDSTRLDIRLTGARDLEHREPKHADQFIQQLGAMFAYSVIPMGGLVLHAAVVVWRGRAILVSAPSGTGKTTYANAWVAREGAYILNGDKALCARGKAGWEACGQPWCGSSGVNVPACVPIGAIVMLERGERNALARLAPFDAALRLLPRAYLPVWDARAMRHALAHIDGLAREVPVYRLACRMGGEAVDLLKAALDAERPGEE